MGDTGAPRRLAQPDRADAVGLGDLDGGAQQNLTRIGAGGRHVDSVNTMRQHVNLSNRRRVIAASTSPNTGRITMNDHPIAAWHRIVNSRSREALSQWLDDDVVFHSPVVHTPQRGKAMVLWYLSSALDVLGNDHFRYVREIAGAHDALLEFETELDGIAINGIDLIRWNDAGRVVDFKVMVRPLKAINLV